MCVIQYLFCVQHLFNDFVDQQRSQEFVNKYKMLIQNNDAFGRRLQAYRLILININIIETVEFWTVNDGRFLGF